MKQRIALVISILALAALSFTGVGHATNGGSLSFNGTNQYVSVAGSSDWAVGTGDFTVEWFQYQTSFSSSWPRIFTVGAYPASIGVSIEGGTMYVWLAGGWRLSASVGAISNQWVHFAVTRAGTTLRIWKNGTQLASTTNSSNVTNSSTPLYVGSEATSGTYFGGLISNFHFVKGTALYTSAFTPAGPITPVADTKLLLLATDAAGLLVDSSSIGRAVTNVNATTFNWGTPFPWTGSAASTSVPATSPPATTTTTTTVALTTTTSVAPTTTMAPTTTVVSTTTPQTVTTTSIAPSPSVTTPPASVPAVITTLPAGIVSATTTVTRSASGTPGVSTTTMTAAATTTVAPTTTTTTVPAPAAPAADIGEVAAIVDGSPVEADLQRANNELIVTVRMSKIVLGAVNTDGAGKSLSGDGALEVSGGESISVRAEGLAPGAETQFWLFSSPVLLGRAMTNDAGRLASSASIGADAKAGAHRLVLSTEDSSGASLNLSIGIRINPAESGGIRWGIMLSLLVLVGGGLAALFLPAVLRRRSS